MATVKVDSSRDGVLIIKDAKTLDRYAEITRMMYEYENDDVTYAFSKEDLLKWCIERGLTLKDLRRTVTGLYGTKEAIDKYLADMNAFHQQIKEECDPQEVYYFEYNNHESFYDLEGDRGAALVVIMYWGLDKLNEIHRFTPWNFQTNSI